MKIIINFLKICELFQVHFGYFWGTLEELICISSLSGLSDLKHVSQVDKSIHSHKWVSTCWCSLGIAFLLKNILRRKWELFNAFCLSNSASQVQWTFSKYPIWERTSGLRRHLQKSIHLDSVISAAQFFIILTMVDWMQILHIYSYSMVFFFLSTHPNM